MEIGEILDPPNIPSNNCHDNREKLPCGEQGVGLRIAQPLPRENQSLAQAMQPFQPVH